MAKNPEHRYATAEDLRADLLRFNEGRTVLAMDDATSLLAVAGTTAVVGTVAGMDATQSVSATPPAEEVEDEEGGPNRTRTYAIILAVLVLLLLVAGYFLARNLGYLGGSASFNLPSVTGQPVGQATAKLTQDGLVVKHTAEISNDTPGTVISSDPAGGTLVKKGDTVTLTVAAVEKVTVPSGITNTTLANAQSRLAAAGLTSTVTNVPNNVAQGTVLSANPQPGTRVPKGSSVTLTVSSGPADVRVPSLLGLTPARGRQPARSGRPQRGQHHLGPVGQLQHRPGHLLQSVRRHVRQAGQLGGHRGLDRAAADHHDVDVDHDHLDDQPLVEHDHVAVHSPDPGGARAGRLAQAARVEARKFDRRPGPSRVSSDSGWNWTPSTARVRWRSPMITPSADRAVTSSTSGMLAGSTTSEW